MFFFLSLFFISGLTQRWWEHWSWFSSQNCYETTHYQKKFLFDNSHWPLRLYKCSIVRALVQLGCVPPNSLLDWEDCKFLVIGDCNRTCRRPVAVTEKMSMLSCVCGYTEKKMSLSGWGLCTGTGRIILQGIRASLNCRCQVTLLFYNH